MIEFRNLTKRYGNHIIFNNFSETIQTGEFVFLVGASGSGKSTLFKFLIKAEFPDKGQVLVDNYDLAKIKDSQLPMLRRQVAVIFQDFKLIPNKTVEENIEFALDVQHFEGNKKHRINELLDLVRLQHRRNAIPRELSGGEKQRVAIARAMSTDPKILLADEPTGNLDPTSTWEIVRLLDEINRTGTTVVMATHDAEIVNTLNTRIILLNNSSQFEHNNKLMSKTKQVVRSNKDIENDNSNTPKPEVVNISNEVANLENVSNAKFANFVFSQNLLSKVSETPKTEQSQERRNGFENKDEKYIQQGQNQKHTETKFGIESERISKQSLNEEFLQKPTIKSSLKEQISQQVQPIEKSVNLGSNLPNNSFAISNTSKKIARKAELKQEKMVGNRIESIQTKQDIKPNRQEQIKLSSNNSNSKNEFQKIKLNSEHLVDSKVTTEHQAKSRVQEDRKVNVTENKPETTHKLSFFDKLRQTFKPQRIDASNKSQVTKIESPINKSQNYVANSQIPNMKFSFSLSNTVSPDDSDELEILDIPADIKRNLKQARIRKIKQLKMMSDFELNKIVGSLNSWKVKKAIEKVKL